MTRGEIKDQLKRLGDVYQNFTVTPTAFNTWCDIFMGYDKQLFIMAVDEVIRNEEFAPKIATINKYYTQLKQTKKDITSKAREAYNRAVNALGSEKSVEEFKALLEYLTTLPIEERAEKVDDFGWRVVSYANGAITRGETLKTFRELLEDEL